MDLLLFKDKSRQTPRAGKHSPANFKKVELVSAFCRYVQKNLKYNYNNTSYKQRLHRRVIFLFGVGFCAGSAASQSGIGVSIDRSTSVNGPD